MVDTHFTKATTTTVETTTLESTTEAMVWADPGREAGQKGEEEGQHLPSVEPSHLKDCLGRDPYTLSLSRLL